jgi:hypothetical protein
MVLRIQRAELPTRIEQNIAGGVHRSGGPWWLRSLRADSAGAQKQ